MNGKGLLLGSMVVVGLLLVVIIGILVSSLGSNTEVEEYSQSTSIKSISLETAQKIALQHAEGSIISLETELENGVNVFAIEVQNQNLVTEVKINVRTGEVVEIETEELIVEPPVQSSTEPSKTTSPKIAEKKGPITQTEAKEIALERVPGFVTDVEEENKFGKQTYVVEIKANSGSETDVIIEIKTGNVLGVET